MRWNGCHIVTLCRERGAGSMAWREMPGDWLPERFVWEKWDGRTVSESLLFFPGLDICPPFLYQLLHIVRDFRVERQAFTCGGMFESQGFRMQCLSGTNFRSCWQTVCTWQRWYLSEFHFPVFFIVEKRVFDIFEMSTDLMGSAGFQNTFNYVHIARRSNTR